MLFSRLFVGFLLVVLAVLLAPIAQADQTPPATGSAGSAAVAPASTPAVTIAQLQAENRTLKAQLEATRRRTIVPAARPTKPPTDCVALFQRICAPLRLRAGV